jgi:hypothetical protein
MSERMLQSWGHIIIEKQALKIQGGSNMTGTDCV